jgi:hypothetical protein
MKAGAAARLAKDPCLHAPVTAAGRASGAARRDRELCALLGQAQRCLPAAAVPGLAGALHGSSEPWRGAGVALGAGTI